MGLGDNTSNRPNIQAKSISCGYAHTIIIDLNNDVWAFGSGDHGQLGLGNTQDRNIPTPTPLPVQNRLIPIMLPGSPNMKAKAASCGHRHTMLIDLNDNVWVFGDNEH